MDIHLHHETDGKSKTSFARNDNMFSTSRYTLSDLAPACRLTQKMSKSPLDDYTVETIKEEDADEILKLLKEFFFKDEPLNTYIELGECEELEKFALKSITGDYCFKAVNEYGKIIGVFINDILKRPNPDSPPIKQADDCKHPKFKKILSLFDYIDTKFNIFDLYPGTDVIMDGKILSVNSNYRGHGIAGRLTERTLQYMREKEIPLMHVLCTSHFSARVMEKLDFHEIFSLPFNEFTDENGEPVLKPALPHTAAKVLVKEI